MLAKVGRLYLLYVGITDFSHCHRSQCCRLHGTVFPFFFSVPRVAFSYDCGESDLKFQARLCSIIRSLLRRCCIVIHRRTRIVVTNIIRLAAVCLITLLTVGFLQTDRDDPLNQTRTPSALFAEITPFEMEMRLNTERICLNSDKNCPDVPAEITYRDADGSEKRLTVSIRTRGRWKTANCTFPALFVFFTPGQTRDTVFEGEKMLPLTTHCKYYSRKYERYALVEYIAHRLYQLLTDHSLHSRLLHVTYVNTDTEQSIQRYGFFTEHFDRLAARTDKVFHREREIDLNKTIPEEMATLALFQFMIGNLDWSAYRSHNVAQFRDLNVITTPVPYDFDFSGLVNAEYAGPPTILQESLHLRNTRHRRYRGFCWLGLNWSDLFKRFQRVRGDVFAEVASTPGLSKTARNDVKKYLESFYGIIDSEKKRRKLIIEKCRQLPDPTLQ